MKRIIPLILTLLFPAAALAKPYFHVGFNQLSGGAFWPLAGAALDQQAGFITPALEHDAADGYLLIPGLSWNPLNLGYIGSVADFTRGKVAFGPSIQTGDAVKIALRWACRALPDWTAADRYGALKALLAPGAAGLYADVGFYEALSLNQFGAWRNIKPETMIGATLNKKF